MSGPRRATPPSWASARPSSRSTRVAASCSSRPRRSRAAIADAGLTPADIDGTVTFAIDANDELALMRCVGIPELRFTSRTRGGGGGACGHRRSTPRRRSRRARPTRSSCTARSTSARVAGSASPSRRTTGRARRRRDGTGTCPFGLDTPAKMYSLWYQRYMHTYGVTNADFGRYPVVARKHAATNPTAWSTTSARSRSTTTRRRAGSSSRSCACSTAARRATAASRWWSRAPSGRATCPTHRWRDRGRDPGAPRATATRCSTTTSATSPTFPEAACAAAAALRDAPGSRPTTSTWR